jgi:nuclear factor I
MQMQTNMSRSPKTQYFPSTMLPPPPLPPMARPVAIIRSTGDVTLSGTNSPPASITPPCSEASPADDVPEISSSPPLSPGSHERRKSPQRNSVPTSSPYSPTRDYSFNHFHGQPGHVALQLPQYERDVWSYQPYESQHVLAQREYVQRYSAF